MLAMTQHEKKLESDFLAKQEEINEANKRMQAITDHALALKEEDIEPQDKKKGKKTEEEIKKFIQDNYSKKDELTVAKVTITGGQIQKVYTDKDGNELEKGKLTQSAVKMSDGKIELL